jgi:hypothetical protein
MANSNLVEQASAGRWDTAKARAWQDSHGWLVGCNFTPSNAVNQLEMWQADTFDPATIDRELGLLAGLGMNAVRVFLHDLVWTQDAKGFLGRIDQFLGLAERRGIAVMPVFFDSCWNPRPQAGPQPAPIPGVHNSRWAASPGTAIMRDTPAFDRLEEYVTGVVEHFRNDPRISTWDVWNEPNNFATGDYANEMTDEEKHGLVAPLLAKAFHWARSARPTQPLTSGVWVGDWTFDEKLAPLFRLQLTASDVISFHWYGDLATTRTVVEKLKVHGRPILCTEYIARAAGSTFEAILPYFKQEKIGAYNWGAVAGRIQTQYPWSARAATPLATEPVPWHHDIFRPDGSPYDPKEAALITSLLRR